MGDECDALLDSLLVADFTNLYESW